MYGLGREPGIDVAEQHRVNKKARLEREIAIIDKQLSENASKSSSMLSNLTLIRKKISNRRSLVNESDKEIRTYSDQIYLKQRSINRLKAKVDTLSAHYSRLVMGAYKNRDPRRWYMYVLASENLGQAFTQYICREVRRVLYG